MPLSIRYLLYSSMSLLFRGIMSHANVAWIFVIFSGTFLKWSMSILFIPERTELTYVNEKYAYNVSAHVVRYGRKSPYYYNLAVGTKNTWADNVTLHLKFFEAQNNQYKSTFVEFHLKLCDMLQRDPYFGVIIRRTLSRHGVACPIKAGMYHLVNVTLLAEDFPNIMPFQKGKVEVSIAQHPTTEVIINVYVVFGIKNKN